MTKRALVWVAATGFAALLWVAPASAQVHSDGIYGRYNTYFEVLSRNSRDRARRIRAVQREARQHVRRELRDARREFRREFDRSRLRALRDYQRGIQRAAREYARDLRQARRDRRW